MPTVQQRFEDSSVGKGLISGLIAIVLFIGIVSNLPLSPLARSLQKVVAPIANSVGLETEWRMYSVPETRLISIEVDVKMANGDTRVWHLEPGNPGVGWWSRWTALKYSVFRNANVPPQLAHWVIGQITKSGERAVEVTVFLHTENLSKPGEESAGKSPATKVLYHEIVAQQ